MQRASAIASGRMTAIAKSINQCAWLPAYCLVHYIHTASSARESSTSSRSTAFSASATPPSCPDASCSGATARKRHASTSTRRASIFTKEINGLLRERDAGWESGREPLGEGTKRGQKDGIRERGYFISQFRSPLTHHGTAPMGMTRCTFFVMPRWTAAAILSPTKISAASSCCLFLLWFGRGCAFSLPARGKNNNDEGFFQHVLVQHTDQLQQQQRQRLYHDHEHGGGGDDDGGPSALVPPPHLFCIPAPGGDVCLVVDEKGDYHAVRDACPPLGVPVSQTAVVDSQVGVTCTQYSSSASLVVATLYHTHVVVPPCTTYTRHLCLSQARAYLLDDSGCLPAEVRACCCVDCSSPKATTAVLRLYSTDCCCTVVCC